MVSRGEKKKKINDLCASSWSGRRCFSIIHRQMPPWGDDDDDDDDGRGATWVRSRLLRLYTVCIYYNRD